MLDRWVEAKGAHKLKNDGQRVYKTGDGEADPYQILEGLGVFAGFKEEDVGT